MFLHGFADSWRAFEPVLGHLPPRLRAIAWTQRGHGGSDKPARGYGIDGLVADLAAFLDALGITAAVLVGGSSGGVIAQRFAIAEPARARGLVLMGSPITLADKPRAQALFESEIGRLRDPIDPGFVRGFAEGVASDAVPAAFFETMLAENMRVPARVWRGFNRALIEEDHTADLPRIAAPTLVLWGDADDFVADDQRRLATAIPRARLVPYRGGGHMLYWEEPERVARDIGAFCDEL